MSAILLSAVEIWCSTAMEIAASNEAVRRGNFNASQPKRLNDLQLTTSVNLNSSLQWLSRTDPFQLSMWEVGHFYRNQPYILQGWWRDTCRFHILHLPQSNPSASFSKTLSQGAMDDAAYDWSVVQYCRILCAHALSRFLLVSVYYLHDAFHPLVACETPYYKDLSTESNKNCLSDIINFYNVLEFYFAIAVGGLGTSRKSLFDIRTTWAPSIDDRLFDNLKYTYKGSDKI